MKWVCQVCGYVHEGDQPPEACPVCKAPAEKFRFHPAFGGQGVHRIIRFRMADQQNAHFNPSWFLLRKNIAVL